MYRETITSTNILARKLLTSNIDLPFVVISEEQTQGKGRLKRSWFSPSKKGLWFSTAFPISGKNKKIGHYNFLVSLAVSSAVETFSGLKIDFKWPNDILCGGKKICGILSEVISEDSGNIVLVGAGLNVDIELKELADDIKDKATSILIETGKSPDRDELFIELVRTLNLLYDIWEKNGLTPLYKEWIKKCATLGKTVSIAQGKQKITGTAESVNSDGSLNLIGSNGKKYKIYAGDIEYIINDQ
ncbi:biotin--[acetyl-CoA-carboxylase] ligase [candidate division KSB1 bacterium]